ncbi:hypothetical protein MY1884_005790 [Beauveria asiatica]
MNEYDYNVFFVSPLGIDDVVKPGEGIYAPGKDDLDPDRSTLKALRQGMRKHWSNPGESSLLSAYQEHIAYEIAHQYLRQGKQATIVVISVLLAVRKEVQFRPGGGFIENQLHIKIPDHLERYSAGEHFFFHHIPDFTIIECRQLRRPRPYPEYV